jgi:hypothetical protein
LQFLHSPPGINVLKLLFDIFKNKFSEKVADFLETQCHGHFSKLMPVLRIKIANLSLFSVTIFFNRDILLQLKVLERRGLAHLPRRRIPEPDVRRHDVHPQPERRGRLLRRLEHSARFE